MTTRVDDKHPRLDLAGVRFLICHSIVQGIMGSTIVAYELACHLRDRGAHVIVFAAFVDDPMRAEFREAGIAVLDERGSDGLALEEFDYVWVHSQVLPWHAVEQLGTLAPERWPIFIFNHMSALELAPDEHPYVRGLEDDISSMSVFVSERTRDLLAEFLDPCVPTLLYPNPAPTAYSLVSRRAVGGLRRVLVVSNHPPDEVEELARLLTDRGTEVDFLGRNQARYERVTPDLLASYDAVITIGKTVQYCLCAGIPVFVYDHWGGDGYLTDDNFERVAYRNFSGRGGTGRRSAEELVAELLQGFAPAAAFQSTHRTTLIERYSIAMVLDSVLAAIERRPTSNLPVPVLRSLDSAQRFGARYYRKWGEHDRIRDANRDSIRKLEEARAKYAALELELGLVREKLQSASAALEHTAADLHAAATKVRNLKSANSRHKRAARNIAKSTSYRLGHTLLQPLRWARSLARRILPK